MEKTTNVTLEAWTAAMAAGKRLGTLGDLMSAGKLKILKDQFVRYEHNGDSAWVTVSEATRKKGLDPTILEVTLRDKINGDPGKVAQATAPGGRPANAADLAKVFG
jgi:hypothetical protein